VGKKTAFLVTEVSVLSEEISDALNMTSKVDAIIDII
jgi:hypothetical protein